MYKIKFSQFKRLFKNFFFKIWNKVVCILSNFFKKVVTWLTTLITRLFLFTIYVSRNTFFLISQHISSRHILVHVTLVHITHISSRYTLVYVTNHFTSHATQEASSDEAQQKPSSDEASSDEDKDELAQSISISFSQAVQVFLGSLGQVVRVQRILFLKKIT